MNSPSYLKAARAADLRDPKDRTLYRFFEMLPGMLSWGTLVFVVLFSWLKPAFVAFFILAFVVYWLLRTLYFTFHLWAGYRQMRRNEKKDWIKELERLSPKNYTIPVSSFKDLWHLVIIPSYLEPLEILQQTLGALKASQYPKEKMIVVFGIEEREGEKAREKATALKKEFGNVFFRFLLAEHPANLPGEIAGKGANETFAARLAKEKIIDPLFIPYANIIISSLDADTLVFPQYFSCLSWYYLTSSNPTKTSFQPIPLYINNIWQAPPISRVFAFSSTFWHTMNQERTEKLVTFSSHAMSFQALVDAGFRAPNVVNDDSHIFWQCFFCYNGNYKVQSIFYPVSMDANAAPSIFTTMKNIYKQHRRWAYGAGEIAYVFFGFLKNQKIALAKKVVFALELLESHWSWATAPLLIFALGWLPLILGGEAFSQTLLSYNLPRFTSRILTFSMLGLIGIGVLSVSLLPPKKPKYGRLKTLFFIAQWILLPLTMIFFMALPALEAQTRWMLGKYLGFWVTPKHRPPTS